jgi:hypothetical protein
MEFRDKDTDRLLPLRGIHGPSSSFGCGVRGLHICFLFCIVRVLAEPELPVELLMQRQRRFVLCW